MHTETQGRTVYGIVAEYETSDTLLRATNKVYDAGYREIDAYAPFPVHGLAEALGFEDPRLQYMIFFGGLSGCAAGFGLLWWICASAYPHNVGGRPLFSWPAFIPVTFECTVLLAALTAVFGMLGLNKLPEPHHAIFDTPNFERASQDAFFLAVEAADPKFIEEDVRALLEDTGAVKVSVVMQEEPEW